MGLRPAQQEFHMAPIDTITGYTHVNILVTDLDAAHAFYIDKLGFSVLPRPDFGGFQGAWYQIGSLQLHLSVVDEMPDLKGGFPHLAFHIPADRYDATIDALKSDGVQFTGDTMSREDFGVPVRAAFCHDPAGNPIELTDVPPLGN
jgi:catechol 2,3-dioxygenase-like lactoylglutathione lyase family enzyme